MTTPATAQCADQGCRKPAAAAHGFCAAHAIAEWATDRPVPKEHPATAQHTPGPWSVDDNGVATNLCPDNFVISGGDGSVVALAHADADTPEALSNARLIAAAPALLAALESILGNATNDLTPGDIKASRAAIRAAKGE